MRCDAASQQACGRRWLRPLIAQAAQAAHSGRPPSFMPGAALWQGRRRVGAGCRSASDSGQPRSAHDLASGGGTKGQQWHSGTALGTAALVASRIVIFLRQPKLSTHAAVACVAWAAWARLRGFARPPSAAQ